MVDQEIGWVAAIIIGGIAGWLAERFMKSDTGLVMNVVLGIVGAAIASAILSFFGTVLVLLCHKLALWQQGHRGSRRAILRANLMRMLVMDDLTWRSARIGESAGAKTVG
jgi:uncharacterized membrane protein YeaQ/YmgE (transglycosylase-associated protein family)